MKISTCARCGRSIEHRQKRTYCSKKCYRLHRLTLRCECGRPRSVHGKKCRTCYETPRADAARRAVNLYRQGHGYREVAKMLEASPTNVWRWLKAAGVEMRHRGCVAEKD